MKRARVADRFQCARAKSAAILLDLAHSMGLSDIQKWVSIADAQQLMDKEKWIAYIASETDTNKNVNKSCGVVAVGLEEEGRLWIELIAVDKRYRRQGIATIMIENLIIWGQANGQRALFVDVDDDNHPAIELYKSNGFRRAGKIEEYYYDSSTALVFVKQL